jgi:RNA polymerase sigma-70 factor (ECF subfamily)
MDAKAASAQGAEPELTPEELRLLAARDARVLGRFFDLWFPRVWGFVRRLVADEHLAEDLTQDIFAHVYRSLASYDPGRELKPWLFTIAANKVRDHWRSRRHRDQSAEGDLEDAGAEELAVPATPERQLVRAELAGEVRRAVQALPEGMRLALVLRLDQGLSFEEVGQALELNEVAARKRYSRALEALRGRLEKTYRLHAEGS